MLYSTVLERFGTEHVSLGSSNDTKSCTVASAGLQTLRRGR